MKVQAVKTGYYDGVLRKEGDEFTIKSLDELSDSERPPRGVPGWMKVLSCSPEEQKELDGRRAAERAARDEQRKTALKVPAAAGAATAKK